MRFWSVSLAIFLVIASTHLFPFQAQNPGGLTRAQKPLEVDAPSSRAQETKSAKEQYRNAIEHFNAGRLLAAKSALENLIRQYPDYFQAYDVYWEVVGQTEDATAKRAAVKRGLQLMEQAPAEKRNDEEFYRASIRGYELLDDKAKAESRRREVIERFPRGMFAQQALLDKARAEKDPVTRAASFQEYIETFNDNISWTEVAARSRFECIAEHLELFDSQTLAGAAQQLEQLTQRFVEKFGNPFRKVAALNRIAEVVVERDPNLSLSYARKGLTLVGETWMDSREFNESLALWFWPMMLRANSGLKNWDSAVALGGRLIQNIDAGSVSADVMARINEAMARRDYSQALERTGKLEEAREQLAIAALLNKLFGKDLDSFFVRYPLSGERRVLFESELAKKLADTKHRREARIKTELLSSEFRVRATGFKLRDLKGEDVSLSNFQGKVVILDFWATWCGPCIGELEELKEAYKKYKDNPEVVFLAVSVDSDKSKVAPHAKEKGYFFPILLSDGTVENPYNTQTIPHLYVIDGEGNIRFQQTGYLKDGYYLKKLDWMIEAARK